MINIDWKGASKAVRTFMTFPAGTHFLDEPGVYIFCRAKPGAPGYWEALYVGESDSLDRRISNPRCHHAWQDAQVHGATHIGVHFVPKGFGDQQRRDIERDLRHGLMPPVNRQLDNVFSKIFGKGLAATPPPTTLFGGLAAGLWRVDS
jgi:hypothetical protein